jgi:hypothetical protein
MHALLRLGTVFHEDAHTICADLAGSSAHIARLR